LTDEIPWLHTSLPLASNSARIYCLKRKSYAFGHSFKPLSTEKTFASEDECHLESVPLKSKIALQLMHQNG
jgi:hypothetical protein